MIFGSYGRYADIDLSTMRVRDYQIPATWQDDHLGGRGIGARILQEEITIPVEPLGEDNLLLFTTGPFQGTGIAGGSRNAVMGVSPVTGGVSDSFVGGYFPHELGKSGYDGLIIRGRADRPVYLVIRSRKVEIRDAADLWGMDTIKAEKTLRSRHPGARVATIGIAGENGVSFACVINDHARAAGRPGFGAVLGVKRLKAVVVVGDTTKPVFDAQNFNALSHEYSRFLMSIPGIQRRRKLGTAKCVLELNSLGILPTKNFRLGVFSGAERISGEVMADTILVRRDTCYGCPVACKRVVHTEYNGQPVDGGGPEYETLAALGSLCMIDDLSALALANLKCNAYGIDTITTGSAIAAAMEATERGLLSRSDGIEWGDSTRLLKLIDEIAHREGVGKLLAAGMRTLEREWGKEFVLHVKGQAVPMHDVRVKKGMGISYATSPRGATHMEGLDDEDFIGVQSDPTPALGVTGTVAWCSWDRKPELCTIYEDLMSFTNSLIICSFVSASLAVGEHYPYNHILELLYALTGRRINSKEMLEIGRRNYSLLRELNAQIGFTTADDILPTRFSDPLPSGSCRGERITQLELEEALASYRATRGTTSP